MDEFLPDDCLLGKAQKYLRNGRFHSGENDNLLNLNLIWGVKSTDRDGTNHWDPEDLGTIVWDDDFNLSDQDA